MKKWICFLLVLVMMFCCSESVFAANASDFNYISISEVTFLKDVLSQFEVEDGHYLLPINRYVGKPVSYYDNWKSFHSQYNNLNSYYRFVRFYRYNEDTIKIDFCIFPKSNFIYRRSVSNSIINHTFYYSTYSNNILGIFSLVYQPSTKTFSGFPRWGNDALCFYSSYYPHDSQVSYFPQPALFSSINSSYVSEISNMDFISDDLTFEFIDAEDYIPPTPTTRNLTINYLYTDNTPAAESVTYPYEPGTEFSIPSPEIPGYLPNRSVISGIMPDEDASIDVFYSQLFYPLTIKYQYIDGSQAAEDAVANYPMGFEYAVPSPEVSGYTPNRAVVSGTMPAQAVTETVIYVGKPYTLTVIYQYENGLQATDTYQGRFITGSHYSVPSPKLEGYSPSVETVTGTMPGNDVTLTVIYKVDSGGSTGAGGTGPGGGGESGGETGGGEFTGKDPFVVPDIPSFSGNDPFTLPGSSSGGSVTTPGIPSFSGRDPFKIYGLPSYLYDPFIAPDSLRE